MEALLIIVGIGILALSIPLIRVRVNFVFRIHPPMTNYERHDS